MPICFGRCREEEAAISVLSRRLRSERFRSPTEDVVTLVFPDGTTEQAILGWDEWLRTADRAICGMANITVGPGSGGCTIVLATPPGDEAGRADDLSAAIGVQPISITSRTLKRMDFVHYFEGGADAAQPRAFVAGSDILGEMTRAAAESIVAATSAWPQSAGASTTVIESLSGAVSDLNLDDTAFPWRRQAACIQWYAETPSSATVDTANQWLAHTHEVVQAHSVGGYANYLEPITPAARYFTGNLARLSAIRQRYDPHGLMYSSMGY